MIVFPGLFAFGEGKIHERDNVARKIRERKIRDEEETDGMQYQLIPAVVCSYGGWHPEFTQWWRGAVRAAAERAGPTASPQGMLWRSVGFLSVTLQRQNFQVLAGCAPTLEHQVQGRLGRPLSEVPEFWRAAPEAAVLWGGEEFGYPPSPRGDALEPVDPDSDLLHSAAGYVRPA